MLDKKKKNTIAFSLILFIATIAFTLGIFQVFALNAPSATLYRPLKMEGISRIYDSTTGLGQAVDTDRALFVGSDILYNGDEDLWISFALPASTVKMLVKIENGEDVSEQVVENPEPNWKLNTISNEVKSYKISFLLKSTETSEYTYRSDDWNTYTVHNVANYSSPLLIDKPFDLHLLSARVNFGFDSYIGKTVRLSKNIVLPNIKNNHIMIGNSVNNTCFEGTFDGAFRTISGINMTASKSLAFFNGLSGTVQDLTLLGSVNIDKGNDLVTAGLSLTCGDLAVFNCTIGINITVVANANNTKAAGFFGVISGDVTMINCTYRGAVPVGCSVAVISFEIEDKELNMINCYNESALGGAGTCSIVSVIDSVAIVNVYNFNCDLPIKNEDGRVTLVTVENEDLVDADNYPQFSLYSGIITGIEPPEDIDTLFDVTWVDYDEESEITTGHFNSVPVLPAIVASQVRPYDSEYTYQFIGWHTESQMELWHDDVLRTLPLVSADIVYYAVYTRLEIPRVTIDYNCAVKSDMFDFNGTQVVVKEVSNKYHTLLGYCYENLRWDDSELVLFSKNEVNAMTVGDDRVTLYAIWEPVTIKIIYNGNGARKGAPPASVSVRYGDTMILAEQNTLENPGYNFFGWALDSGSNWGDTGTLWAGNILIDDMYVDGVTSYNVTLYAVWVTSGTVSSIINIYFDETNPTTRVFTTGCVEVCEIPYKDGYEFIGWSLTFDGDPIEIVSSMESVDLYAIWSSL